jgi:hypothetical protein
VPPVHAVRHRSIPGIGLLPRTWAKHGPFMRRVLSAQVGRVREAGTTLSTGRGPLRPCPEPCAARNGMCLAARPPASCGTVPQARTDGGPGRAAHLPLAPVSEAISAALPTARQQLLATLHATGQARSGSVTCG